MSVSEVMERVERGEQERAADLRRAVRGERPATPPAQAPPQGATPVQAAAPPQAPGGMSRAERASVLTASSHPPPVALGDVVYFYPDGARSGTPCPALVTGVGDETLSLAVVLKDAMSLQPMDGVRHVDDRKLLAQEAANSGAWDYTPLLRGLYAMLEKD